MKKLFSSTPDAEGLLTLLDPAYILYMLRS
jgi:hypothetical protein